MKKEGKKIIDFGENKKSQVAIFVIVGLLITGTIGAIFVLNQNFEFLSFGIDKEAKDVYQLLDDCVKQRAIDAIRLIGLNGGYTSPPSNSIEHSLGSTAYGLQNKRNVLVTKQEIEQEIEDYITYALPYCYDKNSFQYNVSSKNPTAKVDIRDNYIKVNGNMDITIVKEDTTIQLNKKYSHDIQVRMNEILILANKIVEKQKQEKDYIPLTYLSTLDAEIIYDYIDDTTLLYIIHDTKSELEGIPYSFLFATELTPTEEEKQ